MRFWGSASGRDKDRVLRFLFELRDAMEADFDQIEREAIQRRAEARARYRYLIGVPLVVLSNGANLDPSLSNRERAERVREAREEMERVLGILESERDRARKDAAKEKAKRAGEILAAKEKGDDDEDPGGPKAA